MNSTRSANGRSTTQQAETSTSRRPARLVATAIAALSMVASSCQSDADAQAGSSTTQQGWESGVQVDWFDHEWTFEALRINEPEDADDSSVGRTQIVELRAAIRNPMTDASYSLPSGWVSLRSNAGERFSAVEFDDLLSDSFVMYAAVPSEGRGEFAWQFNVPVSTDVDELSIELGVDPDRKVLISRDAVTGLSPLVDVTFDTTAWDGSYSFNAVRLDVTDAWASHSAGRYDDNTARPAYQFGNDRQADESTVFVHIDFDITEYSTSGVAGVNVNEFRIVADGAPTQCVHDGPGGLYGETASFSATCAVPVATTSLTLEIGTDACVGGCTEWAWTSPIDTSFLASFT